MGGSRERGIKIIKWWKDSLSGETKIRFKWGKGGYKWGNVDTSEGKIDISGER